MTAVTVLRVECMMCGVGPYNCHCRVGRDEQRGGGASWEAYASISDGGGDHPTAENDGLRWPPNQAAAWDIGSDDVLFGFADWVQLRTWCRPSTCAVPFYAVYWHIVEYATLANHVAYGRSQVMFNRIAAQPVAYYVPTRTPRFEVPEWYRDLGAPHNEYTGPVVFEPLD